MSVDFFDTTTAATPVSTVFDDDRTAFSFASIYTEDTTLKGEYFISYDVYHTNYDTNKVTVDVPFLITVIDPCDEPVSVMPSTLENQEYTITDNANLPYVFDVYTADPLWCAITYTY